MRAKVVAATRIRDRVDLSGWIWLELGESALLISVGLLAGVLNTLAGGGSLLTVPLLVMLGFPGTVANGTNRLGVLLSALIAAWSFRSEGVGSMKDAVPVAIPLVLGSLAGASLIAQATDQTFERLFGVAMLLLIVPTLRGSRAGPDKPGRPGRPGAAEPRLAAGWARLLLLFGIGLYGGAIQAGVGVVLLLTLSAVGYGLVHANAIKAVVVAALTLVALPVFALEGQIDWTAGAILAIGFAAGGAAGAKLALAGGERMIRPVLPISQLALAGRMLGVY